MRRVAEAGAKGKTASKGSKDKAIALNVARTNINGHENQEGDTGVAEPMEVPSGVAVSSLFSNLCLSDKSE